MRIVFWRSKSYIHQITKISSTIELVGWNSHGSIRQFLISLKYSTRYTWIHLINRTFIWKDLLPWKMHVGTIIVLRVKYFITSPYSSFIVLIISLYTYLYVTSQIIITTLHAFKHCIFYVQGSYGANRWI